MPKIHVESALGNAAFEPETPAVPTEGKAQALAALYGEPAFFGSNDYNPTDNAPFDHQFAKLMGELRQFIVDNKLDNLIRIIDIFTREILAKKFGQNYLFYNELKGIFESVYYLVTHHETSSSLKLSVIKALICDNLLVCGPGTVTRSAEALMNILNPRDINSLLARKRDQIITNIAERLYRKKQKHEGYNSHYALALRADAKRMDLNPAGMTDLTHITDEFFYSLDLKDDDFREFHQEFASLYTAPIVIETIAEFIRAETIDILHDCLDENLMMTADTVEKKAAAESASKLCLLGTGSRGLALLAIDYTSDPDNEYEYLVTFRVKSLEEVKHSVLCCLIQQRYDAERAYSTDFSQFKEYINFLRLEITNTDASTCQLFLIAGHPELSLIEQNDEYRPLTSQEYRHKLQNLTGNQLSAAVKHLAANDDANSIALTTNEFCYFYDQGVDNFDNQLFCNVDFSQQSRSLKHISFNDTKFHQCTFNLAQIVYLFQHGIKLEQFSALKLISLSSNETEILFLNLPQAVSIAIAIDDGYLARKAILHCQSRQRVDYLLNAIKNQKTNSIRILAQLFNTLVRYDSDAAAKLTQCILVSLKQCDKYTAYDLLNKGYLYIPNYEPDDYLLEGTHSGLTTVALLANAKDFINLFWQKIKRVPDFAEIEKILTDSNYPPGTDPCEQAKLGLLKYDNIKSSHFPFASLNEACFIATVDFMLQRTPDELSQGEIVSHLAQKLCQDTSNHSNSLLYRLLQEYYLKLIIALRFDTLIPKLGNADPQRLLSLYERLSNLDHSAIDYSVAKGYMTPDTHSDNLRALRLKILADYFSDSTTAGLPIALINQSLVRSMQQKNLANVAFMLELGADLDALAQQNQVDIQDIYKIIVGQRNLQIAAILLPFIYFQFRERCMQLDQIAPDVLTCLLELFAKDSLDEFVHELSMNHSFNVLTVHQQRLIKSQQPGRPPIENVSLADIDMVWRARPGNTWLMNYLMSSACNFDAKVFFHLLSIVEKVLAELTPQQLDKLKSILLHVKDNMVRSDASNQCELYRFIENIQLDIAYDNVELICSIITHADHAAALASLQQTPSLMQVFISALPEICKKLIADQHQDRLDLILADPDVVTQFFVTHSGVLRRPACRKMIPIFESLTNGRTIALNSENFLNKLLMTIASFISFRDEIYKHYLKVAIRTGNIIFMRCVANSLPSDEQYHQQLFEILAALAADYRHKGVFACGQLDLENRPSIYERLNKLTTLNHAAEIDDIDLYLLSSITQSTSNRLVTVRQAIVAKLQSLTTPTPPDCPWLHCFKIALQLNDTEVVNLLASNIPADYLSNTRFENAELSPNVFAILLEIGNVSLIAQFLDCADPLVWHNFIAIYEKSMLHAAIETHSAEIFALVIDFINNHDDDGLLDELDKWLFHPLRKQPSIIAKLYAVTELQERQKMFDYLYDHFTLLTRMSCDFADRHDGRGVEDADEITFFFNLLAPKRLLQTNSNDLAGMINMVISDGNPYLIRKLSAIPELMQFCATEPSMHFEFNQLMASQITYRPEEITDWIAIARRCSASVQDELDLLQTACARFPGYAKALDDFIDSIIHTTLLYATGEPDSSRLQLLNRFILPVYAMVKDRVVPTSFPEQHCRALMRNTVLEHLAQLNQPMTEDDANAHIKLLDEIYQFDFAMRTPSIKKVAKLFNRHRLFSEQTVRDLTDTIGQLPATPKIIR